MSWNHGGHSLPEKEFPGEMGLVQKKHELQLTNTGRANSRQLRELTAPGEELGIKAGGSLFKGVLNQFMSATNEEKALDPCHASYSPPSKFWPAHT